MILIDAYCGYILLFPHFSVKQLSICLLFPESQEFYFAFLDYKLVDSYKEKLGLLVLFTIFEILLKTTSLFAESSVLALLHY